MAGASTFNRMIGNKSGRRARTYKPGSFQPPKTSRSKAYRASRITRGGQSVPRSATRILNPRGTRMGTSVAYSPSQARTSFANSLDQHVQAYNRTLNEENQIQATLAQETAEEDKDVPWYQDVYNAVGFGGDNNIVENFSLAGEPGASYEDSIMGRIGNLINRVPSAGFNAMEALAGQETHRGYSPGDLWHTIQNAGAAAGRGITGEEMSGGGEWYEALKENPTSSIGGALSAFEEAHPTAEQNLARGVGLGSEIFLDPTNMIGPAAVPVIAKGDFAGRAATPDIMPEFYRVAVEDAATNILNVNSPTLARMNPNTVIDTLNNHVMDWWNEAHLNVAGGGSRGMKNMNHPLYAESIAASSTQRIIELVMEDTYKSQTDLWVGANTGTIDAPTVQGMMNADPDFDEFVNGLMQQTNSGSIDELLTTMETTNTVNQRMYNSVMDDVVQKHHIELEPTRQAIIRDTSNPTYREIGVRVGNKRVAAPFRPVGRSYAFAQSKLDDVMPNARLNASRAVWEQQFPGMFGLKTGRARALAFKDMDAFKNELRGRSSQVSRDEGKLLQRALLDPNHTTFSGARSAELNAEYDWFMDKYRKMYEDEVADGARPAEGLGSHKALNYAYIYLRGGSEDARAKWKKGRKEALNGGGGPYTLDDAIKAGLKPELDAYASLYQRYIKSRRDTARAFFLNDLVDSYGVNGNTTMHITKDMADAKDLHEVNYNLLREDLRLKIDREGGKLYLPKEIAKIENTFREISGWSTGKWGPLGRTYAGLISKLKTIMTLPFTGFQMRNFLGDVFMGLLDNINPKAYIEFAQKWALDKAGKKSFIKIFDGYEISFKDAVTMYNNHANGGFFNIEYGTYGSYTAGNIPKRMGRRTVEALRTASEVRESMGRFTHFMEAYRQEARALRRRGITDLTRIEQQASDAALWRTNYYKYDYNALMPWEKRLKTLAFPFYTYMRKAIPTMLMQMYSNPHYFAMADRFMRQNDGSASESFNSMNIPQWIRDVGFGVLDDAPNPTVITQDALPMGVLDLLGSTSMSDFMRGGVSNLNPVALAPFQIGFGKKAFDERGLDTNNIGSYFLDQLSLPQEIANTVQDIPGVPGEGENTIIDKIAAGDWTGVASERFMGGGLPIRTVTGEQQLQQHNQNFDLFVQEQIDQFNHGQDTFRIAPTDDGYFRLSYTNGGSEIGKFTSPQAAIGYAKTQPGSNYQAPFQNPFSNPTQADSGVATS